MSKLASFSPSLKRVQRGRLCAGCGGCQAVAPEVITMELNGPGFLRPVQTAELSADQDAAIARICPGLGQNIDPQSRKTHTLWGPYLQVRTGWATDPELRFKGSSGGALSGFLAWMIEAGIVESALTNAPDPERAVANQPLLARNRAEIATAAGSRYGPSAPLAALELAGAGPTAFVGKPCDVAAFRARATDDPSLVERFPVVLSFFCAGVPSLAGGEAVLEALGMSPDDTVGFRYRGHGWPGRATAVSKAGREASMTYNESWGQILSSKVQHRCKLCADGTGKAADIVCADAWETDTTGYPLFEEADGISLIMARTHKGAELLARAEAEGAIETQDFDIGKLAGIQPGQTRRRQALFARLVGQRVLGRPVPRYQGLDVVAAARAGSLKWSLKNFLGMIRRGFGPRDM